MEGVKLSAHPGLKKMIILRLKTVGVRLFDNLFICIIIL